MAGDAGAEKMGTVCAKSSGTPGSSSGSNTLISPEATKGRGERDCAKFAGGGGGGGALVRCCWAGAAGDGRRGGKGEKIGVVCANVGDAPGGEGIVSVAAWKCAEERENEGEGGGREAGGWEK